MVLYLVEYLAAWKESVLAGWMDAKWVDLKAVCLAALTAEKTVHHLAGQKVSYLVVD